MAPQRTRTTISFEQRPSAGGQDGTLPRLTLFEHVAGARVLADLFPYYRLPNGKKAYYYYDAGQCHFLPLVNYPVLVLVLVSLSGFHAVQLASESCSNRRC